LVWISVLYLWKQITKTLNKMSTLEFNNHILTHKRGLEYFAYSLTSDREDAKDLMQDTFMKAIAYKDKFREATNLKAWLYTIMKNTFINNYRRQVKSRTIIDQSEDLYYLNNAKDQNDRNPSAIYNAKEIHKEVNALQDEYKVPFSMHTEGFKYKEIADHLDLPIGTVKSRIFLARQKLMDTLSDYNPN
jgi:RNA polymerase sigma factor (sigma-70 family)